ncbi:MAG: O-methyltransferase [Bacteroidales bacterium]|nr:O-methyltransferase [Bacteroidales bacterium]
MNNIFDNIEDYIESMMDAEDEVLKDLTRETYLKTLHPRMISGHVQGSFLKFLVDILQPKNVLEIGCFTGYSTICIASALNNNAKITAVEVNDELESILRKYLNKAGVEDKVELIFGDALKILPTLNCQFDLIYLDAEKSFYPEMLQLIKPLLKVKGILIADNVLWSGKVLENYDKTDKMTKGVIRFNENLKNDTDFSKIIVPMRDGLTLAKKVK